MKGEQFYRCLPHRLARLRVTPLITLVRAVFWLRVTVIPFTLKVAFEEVWISFLKADPCQNAQVWTRMDSAGIAGLNGMCTAGILIGQNELIIDDAGADFVALSICTAVDFGSDIHQAVGCGDIQAGALGGIGDFGCSIVFEVSFESSCR